MTALSFGIKGGSQIFLGLVVTTGIAGCQHDVPAKRTASVDSSNAVDTRQTPPPVYIDLGPIDTVALTASPLPVVNAVPIVPYATVVSVGADFPSPADLNLGLDRPIPASEAILTRQLRPRISVRQNPVEIDQPEGALSDRCSRDYWGGQAPPASLKCSEMVTSNPAPPVAGQAQPGAYIRLSPQNDILLQDADLVVREGASSTHKFSDETLGAILLLETARPQRPAPQAGPDPKDILSEEGALGELSDVTLPPSVLIPGS